MLRRKFLSILPLGIVPFFGFKHEDKWQVIRIHPSQLFNNTFQFGDVNVPLLITEDIEKQKCLIEKNVSNTDCNFYHIICGDLTGLIAVNSNPQSKSYKIIGRA